MKNHQTLKRCVLAGFLCLNLFGTAVTSFAANVSIGRYLSVAAKPVPSQQQLLQQQIQIKFPQNVFTVKQAIQVMLQFSGYRLANTKSMGNAAKAMLHLPLPEVDRTLGPMSLEQGLMTLAGNAFYLLVDPVHRLIAYEIKPQYLALFPDCGTQITNNNKKITIERT